MSTPSIISAAQALQDALRGADPRTYSGDDAASVAEVLAKTTKMSSAGALRFSQRASECDAHRGRGFSNPSEWVARTTGESAGKARAELELASHLDDNPDLKAAVENGDVSLDEGVEIAKTEAECPGSTPEMLDEAKRRGLRGVKEKGRKKRLEVKDPDELAAKRRRARSLTSWQDDELGMIWAKVALEPRHGIPFLEKLDAEVDRMYRAGDDDYRNEPREARAADAFVKLLEGTGKASRTRPEIVAVFDVDAGKAHIPGKGPISLADVRALARDGIVNVVLHNGERVTHIRRFSRNYPVALRLLLELGAPPDFDGPVCIDCGRHFHLQRDHARAVVNGGITELENIDWRCPHCHKAKTEADLKEWRGREPVPDPDQLTLAERGPP